MSSWSDPAPSKPAGGPTDLGGSPVRARGGLQGRRLAPWWKRVAAYLIDSMVLGVVLGLVAWSWVSNAVLGCSATAPQADQPALAACSSSLLGAMLAVALLGFVVTLAYFGVLEGSARGQTLGKRALGIATRDAATGGAIGPLRAAARILIMGLLAFPLLLGLPWLLDVLWPLWDPAHQAWHDKVVGSVVVEMGPTSAPAPSSAPNWSGLPAPGTGLAPEGSADARPGWGRFILAGLVFVASLMVLGLLFRNAAGGPTPGPAQGAITMPHVTLPAPPTAPPASSPTLPGASAVLAAGLNDQFDQDQGLDRSIWTSSTPLLRAMAARLGETPVTPSLAFTGQGMVLAGASGPFRFTGLQSRAVFAPPFELLASVAATVSSGNPFGLFLINTQTNEYIDIAGNLNPANQPYYGIRLAAPQIPAGLGQYLGDTVLVPAPRLGVVYTLQLVLDAHGTASAAVWDPTGTTLGRAAGVAVGGGPFAVVLAQWEGGPRTPGPNVATWRSLTLARP
ncbi:MAG: RDD family protein [Candidatus Limnocylindrales bacterium]